MTVVDTSLFKPELVFFDFQASNRADFFKKLAGELSSRGYIKDTWLDAITTRERNYPTGLACPAISVAVPHTDPEHLKKPYIAIVRTSDPIVFEGMAGMGGDVPATLVVNLGVKAHEQGQVAILQALMRIFMDEGAVADLMSQTTPQGMVDAMTRHVTD